MPDVALVIVNFRSVPDTIACVEAVRRTAADVLSEVVVVDNASGDGSVDELRRSLPEVQVIASEENRGFAAGVNAGVACTRAEHLLVLNPDCEVQEGAVASLLERMRAEPGLGVTGPLLLDGDGRPRQDAYKAWPGLWSFFVSLCLPVGHALIRTPWHPEVLTPAQIAAAAPVARVCGSALFVRRGAWNAVGEMDEGYFMYFEEVEWQRRVAQAGWGIALTKEARVVHLVQGGEGLETVPLAYLRSAFRYHRQRGRSSAAIGRVALAGIALSLGVLAAAGVWPPLAEKAARMRGGYRRLAAVARDEARRPA